MRRLLVLAAILGVVSPSVASEVIAAPISRQPYIVVLKNTVADPAAVAQAQAKLHGFRADFIYRYALKGYSATLPSTAVAALQADDRVFFISPDRELTAIPGPASNEEAQGGPTATCPLDTRSGFPVQCVPPGIDRVEGDRSSARSGDGRGSVDINVAVLDSGIDAAHPDLNVVGGTNCTNDKVGATQDAGYHETFVSGIIAARDNDFGVTGLVPGARLWSVRDFRKTGPTSYATLICGIDFVTASRMDTDPTNDIAVANMSLGGKVKDADDENCGRSNKDAFHLAICNSVAAGVTYAVSAGNETVDIKDIVPAAYDEVLTATAMADFDGIPGGLDPRVCPAGFAELTDDKAAFFSNFASLPPDQAHTVAAPGVCVVSTVSVGFFLPDFDTNYGIASGTSFSSPHVAGLAALCIASGPCAGMTPEEVVQKVVADAAGYNQAHPEYGFTGDPLHSADPTRYYGFLIRAELY